MKHKGFTLIELMIVIAIVGILAIMVANTMGHLPAKHETPEIIQ